MREGHALGLCCPGARRHAGARHGPSITTTGAVSPYCKGWRSFGTPKHDLDGGFECVLMVGVFSRTHHTYVSLPSCSSMDAQIRGRAKEHLPH